MPRQRTEDSCLGLKNTLNARKMDGMDKEKDTSKNCLGPLAAATT
jgi:hypothetical protein